MTLGQGVQPTGRRRWAGDPEGDSRAGSSPEQRQSVPLQLPWPQSRVTCRPVIGDTLLLQYMLQRCSIRSMTELTVRRAREMLTAWAAEQNAVASRRDQVVRVAVDAGVSKSEVHRLTGIARTTVDRIVGPAPEKGGGK